MKIPVKKIKSLFITAIVLAFLLFSLHSTAQEKVISLEFNPVLKKLSAGQYQPHFRLMRGSDTPRPFRLDSNEFFDDFSKDTFGTNKKFWMDDEVFINNEFPYMPPSIGVATFDGLNQYGNPYDPGNTNSRGKIADRLTSVPVDLSIFKFKDSLYLSFFYQPQGLGDNPEVWDSFALEFKPDRLLVGTSWDSSAWVRIWSIEGTTLQPFKQVLIPIKPYLIDTSQIIDTIARFYHKNFQFRFLNYANLSGNLDHWNLDYVYFAKGRKSTDTAYHDIAVMNPPAGLLKTYMSMPWLHLKSDTSYFTDSLRISGRYLGKNFLNFKMGYLVQDELTGDTLHFDCNTDSKDLFPKDILTRNVFSNFKLKDKFPYGRYNSLGYGDTLRLKTTLISCNADIHMSNNYSVRHQELANYYAYDDGTAEAGYGIDLAGYNKARVAYKFKIAERDTLRGVAIYFNQSKWDVTSKPFDLLVWKDDYTKDPDYRVETFVPEFTDTLVNDFFIYEFDTAGFAVDNIIYIGWEQRDEYIMNVGLDKNYYLLQGDTFPNSPNPNIFYYFQNKWRSSDISGALMMRPIIGKKLPVSVEPGKIPVDKKISVYPNPVSNLVNIKNLKGINNSFNLIDLHGKICLQGIADSENGIDVHDLTPGIYFLRIFDNDGKNTFNTKIIVNR